MAKSRRIVWRIGFFFVCVALAVFLYITRHIDLTVYRSPLAQALSLALGRNVIVQGDIQLALSTSPKLTVRHVQVDNPDWTRARQFLTADTLEVRLGLRELWNKRLDIRKIRASGIRIWLEKDDFGKNNWSFTQGEGGNSPISTHISNILIEDAVIHWHPAKGEAKEFILRRGAYTLEEATHYQLQVQAVLDSLDVTVMADIHRLTDHHWRIEPNATINKTRISATIDWRQEDTIQILSARLSIPQLTIPSTTVTSASPQGDTPMFRDFPLPATDLLPKNLRINAALDIGEIQRGPLRLSLLHLEAKYDYPTLSISPVKLRWNESNITVQAEIAAGNDEWRFRVTANADDLDFGALSQGAIPARAKSIRLDYSTHGTSSGQWIRRSRFSSHAEIEYAQLGNPRFNLYNAIWDMRYRPLKGALATLKGTLQSKPLSLQWVSDSFLRAWVNRENARMKLSARYGRTELSIESTLRDLQLDVKPLRIQLRGQRLTELDDLLGSRLPRLLRYDVSGALYVARDYVTGAQVLIETPASYVSGAFFYQWSDNQKPVLRVLLTHSTVDINEVKMALNSNPSHDAPATDKKTRIPDDPLKPLLDIPMIVEINTDKLDLVDGEFKVRNIKLHLRAIPGAIESKIDIEEFVHGKVQATLLMTNVLQDIAMRLNIDIKGFDYGLALKQTGVNDQVQGAADASIAFTGRGATMKSLLRNANARVDFSGGKGVIANRYLRLWGDDVVRQLLPGNWLQEERSQLNCAYVRLRLADGALRTDALVVDTEHITVAGSGGVDIASEQMEFLLSPRPKNPSLLSLATPVRIRGTLAKPEAGVHNMATLWTLATLAAGAVNPVVLLARFASLGDLGNDACRNTAGDAPPPVRNLPSKVINQLNSLVDTLQHPFDKLPDVDLSSAAKLLTAPIPILLKPFETSPQKPADPADGQ